MSYGSSSGWTLKILNTGCVCYFGEIFKTILTVFLSNNYAIEIVVLLPQPRIYITFHNMNR